VAYKPPSSNNAAFIDHLSTTLDLALNKYPNAGIFLLGDFNRCPVSFLLRHLTLKQIVKQPTRKMLSLITGGKFVVADQKIAGRNKAHCIYIQNKAES
jgi:hypothetical protein